MTNTRKILWASPASTWPGSSLLIIIFGFGHKNNSSRSRTSSSSINWVHLGVFSINRAVLYLFIATVLTIVTMVWIARPDARSGPTGSRPPSRRSTR